MSRDKLSKAIHQIKWEAERALSQENHYEARGYIRALSYLMEYDEYTVWRNEFLKKARDIIEKGINPCTQTTP